MKHTKPFLLTFQITMIQFQEWCFLTTKKSNFLGLLIFNIPKCLGDYYELENMSHFFF